MRYMNIAAPTPALNGDQRFPVYLDQRQRDAAFRDLVHKHGRRLQRFLTNNIGNQDEASDMAQQAFLEAVRSYDSYNGQSELSTWLYGIAMNLVRNHLARSPQKRYEFTDESELSHIASTSPTPPEAVEQTQCMRHLQEALAELSADMREVLLLIAIDDLSYEQVAAVLRVPVGTVRSRVSRARTALKTRLIERGVVLANT